MLKYLGIGNNGFQCLQAIVEAYNNYKIVAEEEQTKRRSIANWEKTRIAQIKAQRDIMILYLDRSFDERAHNFEQLFEKPVPDENAKIEKELNFPMNITGDIAEAFEKARSEASLLRRSWVMLAIVEKLKRDGGI